MRVAIVGAGAMGTLLGHGFCKGGHDVSILDLPDRVAQLRSFGKLAVIGEDGVESTASPSLITTDYQEAGVHDVVVLATKSQDLSAVAPNIAELAGDTSTIVTIQNGIPWWYLQELSHSFGDVRIHCLDRDGLLEESISPSQVLGCVAYSAAILEADGRVRHVEGKNFPVGELDGSVHERTHRVSSLFEDAGFKSRIIDDIRSEIWLKAWGALSINPVSALTRAIMEDICTFPDTRELIAQMMREAQEVAEAFGAKFRHTIEKRIEGARAVGAHKTSMLQDVENGRSLELDGLMLAVLELADLAGKKVPTIRNVYACVALLNDSMLSRQR
jgi:2-dehydropantoate 2-reductase